MKAEKLLAELVKRGQKGQVKNDPDRCSGEDFLEIVCFGTFNGGKPLTVHPSGEQVYVYLPDGTVSEFSDKDFDGIADACDSGIDDEDSGAMGW